MGDSYLEDAPRPVALQDTGVKVKQSNLQGEGRATFQSEDSLDLTTSDTVVLSRVNDELEAGEGYDSARAVYLRTEVATKVQASGTAPDINIEDASGNSTGLAETSLADNDSVGAVRISEISGGNAASGVDLSSESLVAKVSTVANDASDTTGTVILHTEVIPETLS